MFIETAIMSPNITDNFVRIFIPTNFQILVSRHSSVDSSALLILLLRVQVPCTPSKLFSILKVYLSLELECEMKENKQKEAGIGPFLKKNFQILPNLKEIRNRELFQHFYSSCKSKYQ